MPHGGIDGGASYSKLLNSFCVRPRVKFEGQHADERLLLLVRAHPITQLPWVVTTIFFFLLPLIGNVFLIRLFELRSVLFINVFWYSLLFSYAFLNTLRWMFTVGIVTNERVVDIDFHSIIQKVVSGTSVKNITDVTARNTGFIRAAFKYDDVFVQTAGIEQNIEFHAVPDPAEVASIINWVMRQNQ